MKKITAILLTMILMVPSLFAIGFGYHVIEAKADVDFAYGVFPLAVNYQFNFPVPDFLKGSTSELAFRLDNGLDFRSLRQNPDDGSFYALTGVDHTTEYMTVYDEFNLFFKQGFWDNHITLGFSIDGRFENAYEAIGYMMNGNKEGLFWDESGNRRFTDSSFIGAPELSGNRSIFNTMLSAEVTLDFMSDEIVRRDGAKFNSFFRITGPWMPMSDGSGDYILSENTLDLAITLFDTRRGSGKNWTSIVLDNSTTYRYIKGGKVPFYAQGGEIWSGVYAPNTEHVVVNRTSMTLYGPQLTVDTYPAVSVFYDFGLSFGKSLNTADTTSYNELVVVYGAEAELMLLDIAKFYWSWGFVTDPAFNEEPRAISSLGFTFGV